MNPFVWPEKQVALTILVFSVLAISGALISQYAFGLLPCKLCLYQRVPYGMTIALSALAFLRLPVARALICVCGIAFFAGAAIAFYHVGVEEHWWRGFDGCSTPRFQGSVEDVMKAIEAAPNVACDQVGWSFIGLSMAAYNMLASFIAGLSCLIWFFINQRSSNRQ